LRFGSSEEKRRIVIDLSNDVSFSNEIFESKVVFKFTQKVKFKYKLKKNDLLSRVEFDEKLNRITLFFDYKIFSPNVLFLKKKNNKYSRIVLDFLRSNENKKIIVIDPGHGGKDSGAIGVKKDLEKKITLDVALLIKKKFEKNKNYKVILTRNTDRYLKLRERTAIAKKKNADIFISLHADYNVNKKIRGVSFYTLSENASDKQAEALARRENKSDLIDGVDLSDETSEVTNILIDLTKRETLNQSSYLVNFLIKQFKNDMNLLQRTHRFAGFAVLKSLDIPSVLIEMGYLSNLEDSKLLVTNKYKTRLTNNIFKAIQNYFYWKDKNKG
jgi:N-acetylmuramoyl-L-alanine amidase